MAHNKRASAVTDEQFITAVQANPNSRHLAEVLGLSMRTIQERKARLAHQGFSPEHGLRAPYPDGFRMGKVTIHRNAAGEIQNTWERMCGDEERRAEIQQIAYQAMLEDLPRLAPVKLSTAVRKDLLAVYPIGDPHVGMYAWDEESGDNWDLKIAEQVHCDAMHLLVQSTPATHTAVVVNLGDLYHYDGLVAKTPQSGHALDADGRYAKMIRVGVKIMRRCVASALLKHQHVHVINAPGNHDETGAMWLSVALSIAYENEPRVTVDLNPSVFAYYRWHKVLLGVHHGHSCKPAALAGVMAADRAKDWGETEHRHWLMGHIHHESKKEFPGVMVESFGTLAAKDAYAAKGGWRSNRTIQGIVYHQEHGEVARTKVSAAMVGV